MLDREEGLQNSANRNAPNDIGACADIVWRVYSLIFKNINTVEIQKLIKDHQTDHPKSSTNDQINILVADGGFADLQNFVTKGVCCGSFMCV